MSFYKDKREAQQEILAIIEKHEKIGLDPIIMKIGQKYGFGEQFVIYWANLYTNLGLCRYEDRDRVIHNDRLKEKNKKEQKNEIS